MRWATGCFLHFLLHAFLIFCRPGRTGVVTLPRAPKEARLKISKWLGRILGDDSMIPCSVLDFMRGRRVRPVYFLNGIDLLVRIYPSTCPSFCALRVPEFTDVVFIPVSFVLRARVQLAIGE